MTSHMSTQSEPRQLSAPQLHADVVSAILSFCDRKTHINCLRVNSVFHEEAARTLYRTITHGSRIDIRVNPQHIPLRITGRLPGRFDRASHLRHTRVMSIGEHGDCSRLELGARPSILRILAGVDYTYGYPVNLCAATPDERCRPGSADCLLIRAAVTDCRTLVIQGLPSPGSPLGREVNLRDSTTIHTVVWVYSRYRLGAIMSDHKQRAYQNVPASAQHIVFYHPMLSWMDRNTHPRLARPLRTLGDSAETHTINWPEMFELFAQAVAYAPEKKYTFIDTQKSKPLKDLGEVGDRCGEIREQSQVTFEIAIRGAVCGALRDRTCGQQAIDDCMANMRFISLPAFYAERPDLRTFVNPAA